MVRLAIAGERRGRKDVKSVGERVERRLKPRESFECRPANALSTQSQFAVKLGESKLTSGTSSNSV